MPLYAFMVSDVCRIVDAFNLKDALAEAYINKDDEYEVIGEEDFEYICSLSSAISRKLTGLPEAITDIIKGREDKLKKLK